jgi:hypothetical protein
MPLSMCKGYYGCYPDECDKCSRYMDDCDGSGVEPNPDEVISERTLDGMDEAAENFNKNIVGPAIKIAEDHIAKEKKGNG